MRKMDLQSHLHCVHIRKFRTIVCLVVWQFLFVFLSVRSLEGCLLHDSCRLRALLFFLQAELVSRSIGMCVAWVPTREHIQHQACSEEASVRLGFATLIFCNELGELT